MAWVGSSNSQEQTFRAGRVTSVAGDAVRAFLSRVYLIMSLGLATTGVVALLVASSPTAVAFIFGNPLVFYPLILGELLLVVAFSAAVSRVSLATASLMFFGYAALSGVTFSAIFLRYTAGSIGSTFLITGGMFAALSAYGVITRRNLDGFGSFLFMGLIGLVIASVVNIFLKSPMLYWLTTFVGVIVFTGLTAYDTAKLKAIAAQSASGEEMKKQALRGALTLYLDFINLFILLLRLFGRRRN